MKTVLTAIAAMALAFTTMPANASIGVDLGHQVLASQQAGVLAIQVARRGADDPANHDINDDRGGNRPKGKGRGGHDDGPNHA